MVSAKYQQVISSLSPHGKNIDGSAAAFIFEDFVLKDKHRRPLILTSSLDYSKVIFCSTTWRCQKNGNNGQVITYSRNKESPALCYVSAILRILTRAQRLNIKPASPIAVAITGKKNKIVMNSTSSEHMHTVLGDKGLLNIVKINVSKWGEV